MNHIDHGDLLDDALAALGSFAVTESWEGIEGQPSFTIASPYGHRTYQLANGTSVDAYLYPVYVENCDSGAKVRMRPLVSAEGEIVATTWEWIAKRSTDGQYPPVADRWFWHQCAIPGRKR